MSTVPVFVAALSSVIVDTGVVESSGNTLAWIRPSLVVVPLVTIISMRYQVDRETAPQFAPDAPVRSAEAAFCTRRRRSDPRPICAACDPLRTWQISDVDEGVVVK